LWCFGSASPAIRCSPDEKSGAAAAVGFITLTAAPFGHLNPIKARAGLLLPKVNVKLPETLLKELSTFQQNGY